MTTNVPVPTFGPNGFIIPSQAAILAGVELDINAAFGGNLNFSNSSSPQAQLAVSMAAIIGNCYALFLTLTQQVDPSYSTGRMQDAIARLYFLTRNPPTFTTLQVTCSGAPSTPIPVNSLVQDQSGNQYGNIATVSIGAGGTVTATFVALVPGPIAVPSSVVPSPAIPGWDSISITSGTVGTNAESAQAFETRRQQSVAQNALGVLPSVLGSVLGVTGVTDAYVTENQTSSPLTVGGQVLVANSLYVCAVGGSNSDVAKAIWRKKNPGCNYTGNTTVTVQDLNSGYNPPQPSYNVSFQRPSSLPILFAVSIVNSAQVPANAAQLIQSAIVSAFSGGDGGPPARIGSKILGTRFNSAVAALGSWAQIISILLGSANTASASFTGVISGTTLTVSGVTGTIAIGQYVTDTAGNVVPGTQITAGSGTTWTVNNSQTVSSEAMTSELINQTTVQVNINQTPTISSNNIQVTLV